MLRSSRASAGHRAGVSVSALAALRAARLNDGTGARRVDQVQLRDEGAIYSEVSEEEYAALVAERRQRGDFVENDGEDSGYADDGEENWADYQLADDVGHADGKHGRSAATGRTSQPSEQAVGAHSQCAPATASADCPSVCLLCALSTVQPSSLVCRPVVARVWLVRVRPVL